MRARGRGSHTLTRYVLDTSAYSHFMSGDVEVVDVIDSSEWIGVPATVIGELWAGFRRGTRLSANVRELQAFLDHVVVEVLDIGLEEARAYGDVLAILRSRGSLIPTNDIWIAAVAMVAGAPVLTYDEHFRRIDSVQSHIFESS